MNYEKFLGKPKRMTGLLDSDRDGVPNLFDCKPYDRNQQGIIHDIAERYRSNKAIRETRLENREKDRRERIIRQQESERIIKQEADKAYYAEKAKVEVEKARERARRGSLGARIGKGILNFASNVSAPPARTATTRRYAPVKRRTSSKKRKTMSRSYKKRPGQPKEKSYGDKLSDMIGY